MAILKIARMGHPVLLAPAEPVADPRAPEIRRLVADMKDTLADTGGVGLAAPQVHVSLRVILVSAPAGRQEGQPPVGLSAIINPVLSPADPENATTFVESWEACLSIPGLRGLVPRAASVRYAGQDLDGQPVGGIAHGFHARVLQHEVDHLNGILYPMRMTDMSQFGFDTEITRALTARAAVAREKTP